MSKIAISTEALNYLGAREVDRVLAASNPEVLAWRMARSCHLLGMHAACRAYADIARSIGGAA